MNVAELARLRWLLGALLIGAAALFAIGVAREGDSHNEKSVSTESVEHNESGEEAEHAAATEISEKVLGLNLESTPLAIGAVLASVALAVATWRTNHKLALLTAGLFAVAFAVLDIAELAHQISKSATGFAALAGAIAAMHLAAALVAQLRGQKPAVG